MADQSLEAKFGIDDSEFQEGMRKLAASIGDLAGKFDQFGEQASSGFGKAKEGSNMFMDSLKDLLPAISAAFAVDKMMEFGNKCMEAAEKADTAFRKLQFSVEKIGGVSSDIFKGLVDWTEQYAQSLNLLYTPAELESAEAQLKTFGLTTSEIKKLLPHIVDLAQATDGDLNSATEKSIQAMMGHGRALVQLGIHFDNTGTKTGNMAELIQKLNKVQGEAVSQMDSFANKDKEMNNQIEETEKHIGDKLTPLWQGAKKAALDFVDATTDAFSGNFAPMLDESTKFINTIGFGLYHIKTIAEQIGDNIRQWNNDTGLFATSMKNVQDKMMALLTIKPPEDNEKGLKGTSDDVIKDEKPDKGQTWAEYYAEANDKGMEKVLNDQNSFIEEFQKKQEEADKKAKEEADKAAKEQERLNKELQDKMVEDDKKAQEAKQHLIEESNRRIAAITTQTAEIAGNALADAMNGKKVNIGQDLFKMLGDMVKKLGEKVLATGALMSLSPLTAALSAGQIAEGGGLIALGTAMSSIKMASGGIVSGSTFANIGEYAGASRNPEVVAPLDKLRSMLGGGGMPSMVQLYATGDALKATLDTQSKRNNFTNGF